MTDEVQEEKSPRKTQNADDDECERTRVVENRCRSVSHLRQRQVLTERECEDDKGACEYDAAGESTTRGQVAVENDVRAEEDDDTHRKADDRLDDGAHALFAIAYLLIQVLHHSPPKSL